MEIVVVYASKTGNTRRAAELIGSAFEDRSHHVAVMSVDDLDYKRLADADLVGFGTWVAGHFVIGQKPGDARRLGQVPKLTGKQVAIFMTYAINPGPALAKFEKQLADEGADVIAGYAWKRNNLPAGVDRFVDGVLGAAKSPASA
ncbi:MAG: flavodoxin domain-containing protein [Acidimicrobiales bacterium]|nr:flavodoxin domain-containing protein [Acidimicrobiales bacterium]